MRNAPWLCRVDRDLATGDFIGECWKRSALEEMGIL